MIFILSLIVDLCSVEATLQGMSAMPAQHHHDTLHCNNHSSTSDSISSERQAFQVPSLHHGEEESLQALLVRLISCYGLSTACLVNA